MMNHKEFFVPYIPESLGKNTKQALKHFSIIALLFLMLSAVLFSSVQNPFSKSVFEFNNTKVTGIFYEAPYPMLRVKLNNKDYKTILLLGFGKFSANPYLKSLRTTYGDLNGKNLSIEGNLIYYNGKTLIQITESEKVTLASNYEENIINPVALGEKVIEGEVIDPKCYFGVMKPGKGKIHRSCAIRCISGGIPPVFVTSEENGLKYYLITNKNGGTINEAILEVVGKPCKIRGEVLQQDDWAYIKVDTTQIKTLNKTSEIY